MSLFAVTQSFEPWPWSTFVVLAIGELLVLVPKASCLVFTVALVPRSPRNPRHLHLHALIMMPSFSYPPIRPPHLELSAGQVTHRCYGLTLQQEALMSAPAQLQKSSLLA